MRSLNKIRSQQNIIVTILFILISISAVVFVGVFVRIFVKQNVGQTEPINEVSSIDLKLEEVTSLNNATDFSVKIYRNPNLIKENAVLSYVKFIFIDKDGKVYSYVDTSTASQQKELETKTYLISALNLTPSLSNFSSIVYLEISSGIKSGSGEVVFGDTMDSYGQTSAPTKEEPNKENCIDLDPGKSFYVDINGICGACSDDNPGTITQPWCSLDRAFDFSQATHFSGGNILYIRNGTYRPSKLIVSNFFKLENDISGSKENPTIISGYPGENPKFYPSENINGWIKYNDPQRPSANIYYVNWENYLKTNDPWLHDYYLFPPQLVAVDSNSPVLLQQVNAKKNADASCCPLESVRTDQSDMIAGDFYYESDLIDLDYGKLFVWLPDSSDPNSKNIEVGIPKLLSFATQNFVLIRNLSVRYCGSTGANSPGAITINGNNNTLYNLDLSYNSFTGADGATCNSCNVSHSILSFNGNAGSWLVGNNAIYEYNLIQGNNYRKYSHSWACGGIKLIPQKENVIVRGNIVKNNHCSGIWFDYMLGGNTIENNIITNNSDPLLGFGIMIEITNTNGSWGNSSKPTIIRNNLIYDNGKNLSWGGGIYISASNYVYIYNNLIYDSPAGVIIHGLEDLDMRRALIGNKVFNNILMNISFPIITGDYYKKLPWVIFEKNSIDYNIFFNPDKTILWRIMKDAWGLSEADIAREENKSYWCTSYGLFSNFQDWQSLGYDTHSRVIDPKLVDVSSLNFQLTSLSPAINTGISLAEVTKDIDGKSRPVGLGYDIGPYEYG